jgi:hypothetical protein
MRRGADARLDHPRRSCRTHAGLAVACSRCDRAGRYRLDTLIARHGQDFGIPDLLGVLSEDCPKRQSITVYDRCGVHYPELPSLFLNRPG